MNLPPLVRLNPPHPLNLLNPPAARKVGERPRQGCGQPLPIVNQVGTRALFPPVGNTTVSTSSLWPPGNTLGDQVSPVKQAPQNRPNAQKSCSPSQVGDNGPPALNKSGCGNSKEPPHPSPSRTLPQAGCGEEFFLPSPPMG